LRSGVKPVLVTNRDFFSETIASEEMKGKAFNGKVYVDLGYYRQDRKFAILKSDKINIHLKKSTDTSLSEDVCKGLYSTLGECANNRDDNNQCVDHSKDDFPLGTVIGSNATNWNIRWISHHAGFNSQGFSDACLTTCKSGTSLPYDDFKQKACSKLDQ